MTGPVTDTRKISALMACLRSLRMPLDTRDEILNLLGRDGLPGLTKCNMGRYLFYVGPARHSLTYIMQTVLTLLDEMDLNNPMAGEALATAATAILSAQ